MLGILGLIALIGVWVCTILVGVKAIQRQQVVGGIFCILCPLVGLIFGWMKATEFGIKNLMILFTVLFVISTVLNSTARMHAGM